MTAYVIEDTYGAPQCGVESIEFDDYIEMSDYINDTPGLYERIVSGYARVFEF